MAIDLFEDGAGGLYLIDRDRGRGWHGMDMAQNEPSLLFPHRTVLTFDVDATLADVGHYLNGHYCTPMMREHVTMLYEREGIDGEAIRVATYEDGEITLYKEAENLGASARWYLADAVEES